MKKTIAMIFVALLFAGIIPASIAEVKAGVAPGEDLGISMDIDNPEDLDVQAPPRPAARELHDLKANAVATASRVMSRLREEFPDANLQRLENLVEENPRVEELLERIPDQHADVLMHMSRAQQKIIAHMGTEEAASRLSSLRVEHVPAEEMLRKRQISVERIENARQNFEAARQRYQNAFENYNQNKGQFEDARERLRECQDIDECRELNERALEHSRAMLHRAIEMIIEHLNKVKERIASSEEIDSETAQQAISKIEEIIERLENLLEKALSAESREEIREVAREIAQEWRSIRNTERIYSTIAVDARVWGIVQRAKILEQRLERAISQMHEIGIDTTILEEKAGQLSEKIEEAENKYKKARELISQARADPEESSELIEQARSHILEAHELLKEANRILIEILREIRAGGGQIPEEHEITVARIIEE